MTIKKSRYSDHTNYLIKFLQNTVSLKKLKSIRSLFNIIVKWDNYHRKIIGPSACSRCQNYGHAEANCHLKERCAYCGECHLTKNCVERLRDDFTYKCCNCGEPHRSTDSKCEKRKNFIEIQKKMSTRNQRQLGRLHPRAEYNYNESSFPTLTHEQSKTTTRMRDLPTPAEEPAEREPNQSHFAWNNNKTGSYPKNNNSSLFNLNNNHIFSFQEISSLVTDIIESLSSCTTKNDQFRVITTLTLKYLYGIK